MTLYAVGIGGTGARCLESLVHLCAMGLGPEELFVLFVDPDKAHGNLSRAKQIITKYQECQEHLDLPRKGVALFKTEIAFFTDNQRGEPQYAWSPVTEEKTLKDYFRYYELPEPFKDLCRLLYTERELTLEWDQGFRGHASIGAPVMANIKNELKNDPWHGLIQSLKKTLHAEFAKIFVFGTIFGGTGASGFPALASILRRTSVEERWTNADKLKIGGALLLPYFAYEIPSEVHKDDRLYARPEDFIVNAKTALSYYSSLWPGSSPFDAIYPIGDQTFDSEGRTFGRGGQCQKNETHYIELLAALSALHFHFAPHKDTREWLQYYAGREVPRPEANTVSWEDIPCPHWKREDLPYEKNGDANLQLKTGMLFFISMALAYLAFYFPLINDDRFLRSPELIPWNMDNFLPGELRLSKAAEEQRKVQVYLVSFLEWVCHIHFSTKRDLRLLNKAVLTRIRQRLQGKHLDVRDFEMDDSSFKTLLDPDSSRYAPFEYGYDELFAKMCKLDGKNIPPSATTTGKLITMLYESVRVFCDENYHLRLREV